MIKKFFIYYVFAFISLSAKCQSVIPISNEIKEIDNKTYYVHTVENGQTLYSISKAYKVTQEQILSANNLSQPSIKVGQKLLIPKNEINSNNSFDFIEHKVVPGETLFGLSKLYNVSIEDIIKWNPEAKNGIKTDQILKIRKKNENIIIKNDDEFYWHKVKKDNTLYSLSKYYGISTEEIIRLNPNVKDGLIEGQTIKLPRIKLNPINFDSTGIDHHSNNLYFEVEGITPCKDFSYSKNMTFNIVMMLPLFLDQNIYYLKNYKDKKDQMFFKNSQKFIEIYEGALIAANKLKSEGLSLNIKIVDTRNDDAVINDFISKCNPNSIDLIIGPIYSSNLKIVSEFVKENKLNIISPLSTDEDLIKNNPFIFQILPSEETVISNTAKIINNSKDSLLIFINNGTEDEINYIESLILSIKNDSISRFIPEFISINYKNNGLTILENSLKKEKLNTIFVSSTDEVFISQLLDVLERLCKEYRIKTLLPQKTENFQNTTFNHLSKLNVRYISYTYIDYLSPNVQTFIQDYRSVFHTEPSLYAFEGYDIVYYFSNLLRNYGRHFQFCFQNNLNEPNKKGIVFGLNFKRNFPNGGFENIDSYILKYNDQYNLINVTD